MAKDTQVIPTRADGSADLMGIYRMMFEQAKPNTEVNMVEGSLEVIHRLVHQPYVMNALAKGVKMNILYTGEEPKNKRDRLMLEEIAQMQSARSIRLTNRNQEEFLDFMEMEMADAYQQLGVAGVTNHLMQRLYCDGVPMDYSTAKKIAISFEAQKMKRR